MSLPPTADTLPAALVDREQWVCWRTQERDGKRTKVPIIPGRTQFASTTDPETWRSFETAREGVTTTPVDGLGFVFTADDPLIGIDLDACRDPESGEPAAWAERIIAALDSYTEVSPSGTGYHILVTGTLPDGRNRRDDIELYDRSRFFTVTGDHVTETPETVCDRDEAVASVHAEAVAATTAAAATADADQSAAADTGDELSSGAASASDSATLSDTELLARARNAANGAKFNRLWNGRTDGYESHSEADLALCRLLAFWTGRDAQRIDRLFRDSGLYRDKWDTVHYADGSTYGDKTIERAITYTDEVYTPPEATDEPATSAMASPETATGSDAAGTDAESASATESAASSSAGAATAIDAASEAPTAASQATTAEAAIEEPHTRTQRAEARLARLEELTARVEELLAENERLRADLEAERDRREELEAAREAEQTDEKPSIRDWWPFSTE